MIRLIKGMLLLAGFILPVTLYGQNLSEFPYYQKDAELSLFLNKLTAELELDKDFEVGADGIEQVSLAVIDLSVDEPRIAGVNMDNFIYPASVYKMYVAATVLKQISEGRYGLNDPYIVKAPNDVDTRKEIRFDPRPLLQDGDTVTVHYLLDLMITRSDNSAANCLIDLAGREDINALMHANNWEGSEVTRKFLSRKYEDPGYEDIRGTETSALHAADFMYKIHMNELVNPWVSRQMKVLLGGQLDTQKLEAGLPKTAMFYHKTGWFSYWTNDVGIVEDGKDSYIISVFLPVREEQALPKFRVLAERIHERMTSGSSNNSGR